MQHFSRPPPLSTVGVESLVVGGLDFEDRTKVGVFRRYIFYSVEFIHIDEDHKSERTSVSVLLHF